MPSILSQVKSARRVSVPLVAITTPDPAATVKAIVQHVGGGPMLQWDVCEGIRAVNDEGKAVLSAVLNGADDLTVGNPVALLSLAKRMPPKTVLFLHMANRLIVDPMALQAVWNLRDEFKRDQRMLVLLAIHCDWPAELAGDLVVLDEPLPDSDELRQIVERCHANAELPMSKEYVADTLPRAVEAVQGLPAFQVEQVVAMSLTRQGVDVPALWERKRKQIELTPGLKVCRDESTFKDIGGTAVVKNFLSRVMAGNSRPNAVVFIDEIEKCLAGATGAGDSTGVSKDQLGQLLTYMQDNGATGCIFVGPPGSGKSAVAKAAGNEGAIPTIQLDLGAMRGSLVGQSEASLRSALKVVSSVSNGKSLWIATANAIGDLPPELRRRFTLGTFFFDLPDAVERAVIWKIWMAKYALPKAKVMPDDTDWTGAEIRQCCDISYRLACSLKEAAAFVVPVSKSAAEQMDRLRRSADGRFLSASRPGVYTRDTEAPVHRDTGKRKMELAD
jgi:hypothetical protein